MLTQPIRKNLLACILVALVAVMASELLGAASARAWTWKELTPSQGPAPEPRRHGVTIYDPVGKRVIVFGGQGESGLLNDLWAFDLTSPAWSLLDASGTAPAPRRGHNAIYDPVAHQMIVWAGQQGALFFNDTWALSLTTLQWREISPSVRPAPRYGSASIFDPVEGRLVQFAGFTNAGRFQDTQAFDLTTLSWQDLTPPGIRPQVRCLHTAAFDPTTGRMIVYGGQRTGPLGDLWAFDLGAGSWTELTPVDGLSGRYFTTSFVDREGSFIVFGGVTASGNVNETWSYSSQTDQWTELSLESPPAARNGMMGAYVAEEDRFVVFGGVGTIVYNDIWELSAITAPTTQLFFAFFADGAGISSEITLVNLSATQEVTGKIETFDSSGAPLTLDLNNEEVAGEKSFMVPAAGAAVFATGGLGAVRQDGAVVVSSDLPLSGVILFVTPALGVAGVGSSQPLSSFLAPVEMNLEIANGILTGIAVMNLESTPQTLQVDLFDLSGTPVATGTLGVQPLAGKGSLAAVLNDAAAFQFTDPPDLNNFRGVLKVTASSGQIAATVLRQTLPTQDEPAHLATLPVTQPQ